MNFPRGPWQNELLKIMAGEPLNLEQCGKLTRMSFH